MKKMIRLLAGVFLMAVVGCQSGSQTETSIATSLVPIGEGWSQTSVNATIFQKNSVVSSANYQFVAYYDSSASVVLARRKHRSDNWEIQ